MYRLRIFFDFLVGMAICLAILAGMFLIYSGEMRLLHELLPFR